MNPPSEDSTDDVKPTADSTTPVPPPPAGRAGYGIAKKFAFLFGAHWVREALQAVFLLYLARKSQVLFGQFMLAASLGQITLFIAEFGLNQQLARLLAQKADRPSAVLAQITLVKGCLLSAAWIVMLGFIFWQDYEPDLKLYVIVVGLGVGLEAFTSSFFIACQMLGRQDVEGKVRSLGAVAGFGFGIAALFANWAPIFAALFKIIETFTALTGALVASFKHFFKKRVRKKRDFKQLWEMWRGGVVFTLIAFTTIFYNKINMLFLQKAGGSEAVAQYSATWQIVDGVSIMASDVLIKRILFPLFVKLNITDRAALKRLAQEATAWLLAAALPVMFVLFVESDRIIGIVYGKGYEPAADVQRILVGCVLTAFIHNLAADLMVGMKRERLLFVFYVIGFLFNLAICWLIIPSNPLHGACIAILVTKLFVACMTVGFAQWSMRIIPLSTALPLLGAIGLGAGLYFGTREFLFREASEALALVPILVFAWKRRRRFQAATATTS